MAALQPAVAHSDRPSQALEQARSWTAGNRWGEDPCFKSLQRAGGTS